MPNPRLASRYAKSLIDLSLEIGKLEEVYADMQWLRAACKSNRDLVNLLKSPVINADTKKKIMTAVTKDHLSEITQRFNALLITKGREGNLPEIVNAFISSYKEHKNIKIVKLTTASEISDKMRTTIMDQVKRSAGFEKIEMEEKVDPSLIGGFVLQIGDQLIDASVSYDLREIAKQFENNDFIYKVR